jgi:hypothetical protein
VLVADYAPAQPEQLSSAEIESICSELEDVGDTIRRVFDVVKKNDH